MTVISTKEAKKRKMEPLTCAMLPSDPVLFRCCQDMKNIDGTVWGLVNAGSGRVEIWRKPVPRVQADGRILEVDRRFGN